MKNLTPTQIVGELNKFIIGQDDAKRAVAIALRNRWRRQQVTGSIKEEIIFLIFRQEQDTLAKPLTVSFR